VVEITDILFNKMAELNIHCIDANFLMAINSVYIIYPELTIFAAEENGKSHMFDAIQTMWLGS